MKLNIRGRMEMYGEFEEVLKKEIMGVLNYFKAYGLDNEDAYVCGFNLYFDIVDSEGELIEIETEELGLVTSKGIGFKGSLRPKKRVKKKQPPKLAVVK